MTQLVEFELVGNVALITLDSPPVNAISAAVEAALIASCQEATHRREVRAIVLTGSTKAFSAGADIKEMSAASYQERVLASTRQETAWSAVASIPKPVIAAIRGYALGGGCELALCCDLRIAGASSKFGQPETLLGLIPGAGGTQRLTRLVGPGHAKDLIMTGRLIQADEALRMGLVTRVVADDRVLEDSMDLATNLAAGPRFALRAAKEAVDFGSRVDLETALEMERLHALSLSATTDMAAGIASFIEHGPGHADFRAAETLDDQ